jgi:dUTP pyrophosphatase
MTKEIETNYTPILLYKSESPELAPARAHSTDAGLDLRAKQEYIVHPNERQMIGTGVSVSIPEGYVGLLFARSSLSKKGLMLANSVGVIDSDYRGEIMAPLVFTPNDTNQEFATVEKLERIVQLVITPIQLAVPLAVDTLTNTARGAGGFGSTGKS